MTDVQFDSIEAGIQRAQCGIYEIAMDRRHFIDVERPRHTVRLIVLTVDAGRSDRGGTDGRSAGKILVRDAARMPQLAGDFTAGGMHRIDHVAPGPGMLVFCNVGRACPAIA